MDVKKESPPVAMGGVTQPLRPHLVLSEESHMSALQDRQEEGDTEGDRWPHPLWSQAVPSVQPLSESQKMCSVSVVTAPSFRVTAWGRSGAAFSGVNPPVALASLIIWPLTFLSFALKKSGGKAWPVDFTP